MLGKSEVCNLFFQSLIVALFKNIFSFEIFNITKVCMGQYWESEEISPLSFFFFLTVADIPVGLHLIYIYIYMRNIFVWKIIVNLKYM